WSWRSPWTTGARGSPTSSTPRTAWRPSAWWRAAPVTCHPRVPTACCAPRSTRAGPAPRRRSTCASRCGTAWPSSPAPTCATWATSTHGWRAPRASRSSLPSRTCACGCCAPRWGAPTCSGRTSTSTSMPSPTSRSLAGASATCMLTCAPCGRAACSASVSTTPRAPTAASARGTSAPGPGAPAPTCRCPTALPTRV
ncbi:unnamed protein product, partial [Gulo gulo]